MKRRQSDDRYPGDYGGYDDQGYDRYDGGYDDGYDDGSGFQDDPFSETSAAVNHRVRAQQSQAKRKKKKKVRITVIVVVVLALLIGEFAILMNHWVSPPSLTGGLSDGNPDDGGDVSADGRKKGCYTFLIAGKDRAAGLTDTVLVGMLDTENKSLKFVSIPRDTAVNVSYKPKKPSTYAVSVNVGELYRKSVDVRCDIQGAVAEGYIAGEVQCQPNVLELRGQQAEVEKISYAKVVLPIDNIKETTTQTLTYKLYDENDREVDSVNVHPVTDRIQVVLPVNVIKELPLVINFVEAPGSRVANLDYTIEPLSVTVSGDAALLRDVDSIVLEESFDLESFSGEATYNYQITLPDGCENLSGVTRATLKIRYKDLVTATVTTSRIEYENAPEGKTVTVLTSDLPVTLRGTSADVNAVTPEDVILLADLRDVSSASGSYTVPVEVRVDTNGDVGVVGTYQIRITISDIVEDEEPGIGDENDTDSNG